MKEYETLALQKGFVINGVTLDASQILQVHQFYATACLQEYIHENHPEYTLTLCWEIAEKVGNLMEKENLSEEEAIKTVLTQLSPRYLILQLKHDDKGRGLLFESYDSLMKHGFGVDRDNYDVVYEGELEDGMTLNSLYEIFNIDHPEDFKGHSLSVSDVIVLIQSGEAVAYYVDSIGFKVLEHFFPDN